MDRYVEHIQAEGVYGRLNFDLTLYPTLNIIHAGNGAGKTTLLHILANALNGHFERFAYLNFGEIVITLSDTSKIVLRKEDEREKTYLSVKLNNERLVDRVDISKILETDNTRRNEMVHSAQLTRSELGAKLSDDSRNNLYPILPVSYFPAFRTMIEAWANNFLKDDYDRYQREVTRLAINQLEAELRNLDISRREARYQSIYTYQARQAFGSFVPIINYPSPSEITENLDDQIRKAIITIANKDRELLFTVFRDVLTVISQITPNEIEPLKLIIEEIEASLSKDEKYAEYTLQIGQSNIYDTVRRSLSSIKSTLGVNSEFEKVAAPILDVYRKSLRERSQAQENAFQPIELYLNSVNQFLKDKELFIHTKRTETRIAIKFNDGNYLPRLHALSSGERQIVTLIYAASRMSSQKVVLIDEPEISLHIDWQRDLLGKMVEQLGDRQIIVCTHSPSIGANYLENMIELVPSYTVQDDVNIDVLEDDDIPF